MESIFETLETLPVSEECYNDILDIIGSILFEEKTDDELQKDADFYAERAAHYANGEGRRHPYSRELARELGILHKMTLKDIERRKAAAATKQPV